MSQFTSVPNGIFVFTGTVVGAATAHAALSDSSDATYVQLDEGETVSLTMDTTTIPAGAVVKDVVTVFRTAKSSSVWFTWAYTYALNTTPVIDYEDLIVEWNTPTNTIEHYLASFSLDQTDIDGLLLACTAFAAGAYWMRVYKFYAVWTYAVKPVVTVDEPSGTITDQTSPPIEWSNTLDTDGGAQTLYEVIVYSLTTNPTPDPDVDDDWLWATGAVASGDTSIEQPVELEDDDYEAHVRVAQTVNGVAHWSDWDGGAFTIDVLRPGVPTIALTPSDYFGRMTIDLDDTAGESGTTTDYFHLQRSDDGGATWLDVRTEEAADVPGWITPAAGLAVVGDYEGPNGKTSKYRVRSAHSYSGFYAYSDWAEAEEAWTSDQWWIKHPYLPIEFNLRINLRSYGPIEAEAQQGVFRPLGAKNPVVISDTRGTESGKFVARLDSADERNALERLVEENVPVLVQGPAEHEEQDRWVALGNLGTNRIYDSGSTPYVDVTVDWTVVDRPEGALVTEDLYWEIVLADRAELLWKLDESSGTVLADASGNEHTGKIYNDQVVSNAAALPGVWTGVVKDSVYSIFIDGLWTGGPPVTTQTNPGSGFRADDYKPYVPGSARSFECWVAKSYEDSFATTFSASGGSGGALGAPHPTWEMGAGGLMRYYPTVNTFPVGWVDWGSPNTGHPNTDFDPGPWTHIVCTFDDNTGEAEWWVDGVSQGKQDASNAFAVSSWGYDAADAGFFQWGWRGGAPLFPNPGNTEVWGGLVDMVAVYEYILTPEQIERHYRAGIDFGA